MICLLLQSYIFSIIFSILCRRIQKINSLSTPFFLLPHLPVIYLFNKPRNSTCATRRVRQRLHKPEFLPLHIFGIKTISLYRPMVDIKRSGKNEIIISTPPFCSMLFHGKMFHPLSHGKSFKISYDKSCLSNLQHIPKIELATSRFMNE